MSKKNNSKDIIVKNSSVGRRHNRSKGRATVNQDVAASPPKWVDIGSGVLEFRSRGKHGGSNYIRMNNFGKFESLNSFKKNHFLSRNGRDMANAAE